MENGYVASATRKTPRSAGTKRKVILVPEYILEVNGLTKRFGGLVAVNEFEVAIRTGEIKVLIGPKIGRAHV